MSIQEAASLGGVAAAASMTRAERRKRAKTAITARWSRASARDRKTIGKMLAAARRSARARRLAAAQGEQTA